MTTTYTSTTWESDRKSITCFEKFNIQLDAPVSLSLKRYYFDLIMTNTSTTWATGGAALRFLYGVDAGVHDIDLLIESYDSDDAKYILGEVCSHVNEDEEMRAIGMKECYLNNGVVIRLYSMNYVYEKDLKFDKRFLRVVNGYRAVALEQLIAHWAFKLWAYTLQKDTPESDRFRAPWLVRDIIDMYHKKPDWGLVREAIDYFKLRQYIEELWDSVKEDGNELVKVGYSLCYEWWGYPVSKCREDFLNAIKNMVS